MGNTQLHRDEQLSRALYGKHADALLSYVQRLMHGDRQLAEDIVQETMLRAWQHADQRPPDAQLHWLCTVARRLVIDAYRTRTARPPEVSADALATAVANDDLDTALAAVLLTDALHAVSAKHRSMLIDCYQRATPPRRSPPPGTFRPPPCGPGSTMPVRRWVSRYKNAG